MDLLLRSVGQDGARLRPELQMLLTLPTLLILVYRSSKSRLINDMQMQDDSLILMG